MLLLVVPLAPGAVAGGDAAALVGLPVESLLVLLVLRLLPWRPVRVVVAAAFGLGVVLALALAAVDAAYESVLDIPFDPLDWQQLGDALGVVRDSVGRAATNVLLVLLAVAAAGTIVALAWAALRIGDAVRAANGSGTLVLASAATAWMLVAAAGAPPVSGPPVAAAASIRAVAASTARAEAGLAAVAELPQRIAGDPFRDTPGSALLGALRGKDVVVAFIESYGVAALRGGDAATGVAQTLHEGEAGLRADGYAAQSAFLTSPTFGGLSWLAHATLQSGLWVDRQPLYSALIRSERLTLAAAFGRAGWRTVSDIPSNTGPWPFGTSFYHYDRLAGAGDVGYRGPAFGYARIPDQYTWKRFAETELAPGHAPVMAEIDLVSSHTPWAPLPRLVPWDRIGDGAVFASQPKAGESATEVWRDPRRVQRAYAASIRYALGAMFSFLHEVDDPDLVVVVLGDHQPATIVSGTGASHDVPISIIASDPAVFAAIDGWHWRSGLLPGPDAPVWRMSAFRDRFLEAFSGR